MKKRKAYMGKVGHNSYTFCRWDPAVGCYQYSASMSYWEARVAVGEANCRHAKDGLCKVASHQHASPGRGLD